MRPLLAALLCSTLLPAQDLSWDERDEAALSAATLTVTQQLHEHTCMVGRLGTPDTRVAVIIDSEGHLLAPHIFSIDGEEAPYLLYRSDGSRQELEVIAELPKRFVAVLKAAQLPDSAKPIAVSSIKSHTVMIPTCAPIATLGEPISLGVDHLEFPPLEEARAFRLDSTFFPKGSPILDPSGALIGTTLQARESNTPGLHLDTLIGELPLLDSLLADPTESTLPDLPRAPELTSEERREVNVGALTQARRRYLQSTHPAPLPCVLISNEGSAATNSVIGTIVDSNGLILTKASDLGPSLTVRFQSTNYPAVLLATDEETDLALVGIVAQNLPVITWSDEQLTSGAPVASPILLQETTDTMVAENISYGGVWSHVLEAGLPTVHATSQVTSLGLTTEQLDSGLRIAHLKKGSPAAASGLKRGDLIQSIDFQKVSQRADLTRFLNHAEVGQKVEVVVIRGEEKITASFELIAPLIIPPATGVNLSGGISMIPSIRRAPFPDVFVHTTPLNAWDCGSPLFDLQGHAIALNIAAVSPSRSLALPPHVVRAALERLTSQTRPF